MGSGKATEKAGSKAGANAGEKPTTMTGARILWECLEREGVKTVFGVAATIDRIDFVRPVVAHAAA